MASPIGLIAPSLAARRTRPAGDVEPPIRRSFVVVGVPAGWVPVETGPAGASSVVTWRVIGQTATARNFAIDTNAALAVSPSFVKFQTSDARTYEQFVPPATPTTPTPLVRWAGPGSVTPVPPNPATDLRNGLLVSGAPSDAVFVLSDEASPAAVIRDERGVFVPHAPAAYTVRAKSGNTVAASQINSARSGEIPVTWDAMVAYASRIRVVGAGSGEVRINGADVRAAGFTDSRGAFVVASVTGSQGVTVDGRTVTVAPQSGQTVTITFPEGTVVMGDVQPAPIYGTIDLYGLLPTDGVLLDGVTTVPTMDGSIARLSRVSPGTHTLVVNRPNAAPFTTQVTVSPSVNAVVMLDFGPSQQTQQSSTLGWLAVIAGVGGFAWWASRQG